MDKVHFKKTRNYALFILVLVYTFNFIDRQILSILLESIKDELQVTDQALGFLSGFAFAAFYATLGIPIAVWADRGNRKNLISLALFIWSIMTALSGLAQNFVQLALARIGVAIGEAGGSPPAHSLISDYFPSTERATALGIYALGIPFGVMFGLFLGGWINENFGWRAAFFIVGIPGIVLALIVRFTLTEPKRGQSDTETIKNTVDTKPSLKETLAFLMAKRSFIEISIASSLAAFTGYGVISWYPSFLIRSHNLGTAEIGLIVGLIIGLIGGIGMYAGGKFADALGSKNPAWYMWTPALIILLSVPFAVLGYVVDNLTLVLLLFIVPTFASNFWQATSFAQAQSMSELRMRSTASALLIFFMNIVGLGFGPWAVGLLSDFLNPRFGAESLRWSLCILSIVNLWAAFHFYLAGKYLKNDLPLEQITLHEKQE